jgi:hypothetical protein
MNVDPSLVVVFGSENRLRILAVLANAQHPLTAYRVAQIGDVRAAKAYPELRRLAEAGLVEESRSGWILRDEDVGALLRKRVRVIWDVDWFRGKPARDRADRRRDRRLKQLPPPDWGGLGRIRYDVRRRRAKDELLVQSRLRPSVTHGR